MTISDIWLENVYFLKIIPAKAYYRNVHNILIIAKSGNPNVCLLMDG